MVAVERSSRPLVRTERPRYWLGILDEVVEGDVHRLAVPRLVVALREGGSARQQERRKGEDETAAAHGHEMSID